MCYNTGNLSPKFYFHENQILYCTVIQSIAVNMCVTWFNPYSSSYLSRAPETEESGKIFQLHEDHPFLQRPHVKSKGAFSWSFEVAANSDFIPWTAKFYLCIWLKKKFCTVSVSLAITAWTDESKDIWSLLFNTDIGLSLNKYGTFWSTYWWNELNLFQRKLSNFVFSLNDNRTILG